MKYLQYIGICIMLDDIQLFQYVQFEAQKDYNKILLLKKLPNFTCNTITDNPICNKDKNGSIVNARITHIIIITITI